jgi:hypothetical protein
MTQDHDSTADPVFAGLFADVEVPSTGSGSTAGSVAGTAEGDDEIRRGVLRPYLPFDESVLADLAGQSALVIDALALAQWVGQSRSLTEAGQLESAEAAEAAAKLGLADPDRPTDLTELQVLWSAVVEAGVIRRIGATAESGDGVSVWQQPSAPQARLDSWSRLVAGLLRARAERNVGPEAVGGLGLASTPLYYSLARHPMPATLPALVLATSADADEDGLLESDPVWIVRQLPIAVDEFTRDWVWAGVLAPVEHLESEDVEALDEMFDALAGDIDETGPLARALTELVEQVQASPIVRLSALGDYGLRRVLMAHGWQVPLVGAVAEVSADRLLDLLVAYPPQDALVEAGIWLEARGENWLDALRRVAASARSKDPEQGPGRRAALGAIFRQVGPPVLDLLDLLADDPWLFAVAADARFELGLGPEPTMAEELWLIVDGISTALEGEDDEKADAVEDSDVLEFLRLPGAVAAADTLTHPHTRYVLQLVVAVSGDEKLAHQLRRTLEAGPIRPGKGRAKRRR